MTKPTGLPSGRPFIDLRGRRFGSLVALHRVRQDRSGNVRWRCQCDCGGRHTVRSCNLLNGSTISCGCRYHQGLPGDTAGLNEVYGSYKMNARKNNRVFDLSKEEFREITSQPCAYCNASPIKLTRRTRRWKVPFVYNGLDRMDNTQGYTRNNCAPCCWLCNVMKRDLTVEEFLNHIQKIALKRGVLQIA